MLLLINIVITNVAIAIRSGKYFHPIVENFPSYCFNFYFLLLHPNLLTVSPAVSIHLPIPYFNSPIKPLQAKNTPEN